VYENAPLATPSAGDKPWPLVLFSHGLAGTRTTYSVLCAHLAAQGRVVLALEHRDGSGPAVFPRGRRPLRYVPPDDGARLAQMFPHMLTRVV
jgi:platelet-activating factor acetylhydrolase